MSNNLVWCENCKKEKSLKELTYEKKICRICDYLMKNKIEVVKDWSLDEYVVILDNVLNKKIETINEIIKNLNNKNFEDLVKLLKNTLKMPSGVSFKLKTTCSECGDDLIMTLSMYCRSKRHFCSNNCRGKYASENKKEYLSDYESRKNRVEKKCKVCGSNFDVRNSAKDSYSTCSKGCSLIYQEIMRKERGKKNRVRKICVHCKKEYDITKNQNDKYNSRFCSNICKNLWQSSEHNCGENNPAFKQQEVECEWCGTMHHEKISKIKTIQKHFCSIGCRQDWYAKVYSQSDEWKKESKIRAVKILESGVISQTESKPQLKLDAILKEMKIRSEKEYNCKYYAIDNYLSDYNLMIECQGGFWHADNRNYKVLKYKQQTKRIKTDKSKNTYIKNNYKINILYLWEDDILKNDTLCKKLIEEYIKNKGVLQNYQSFNYILEEEKLKLQNDLIIPYMEWSFCDLKKVIELSN